MYDLDSEATATLGILTCDQMARIAIAARSIDTPLAKAVEMAVYMPCDIQAVCHSPIELIDSRDRSLCVLDQDGRWNRMQVGPLAATVIDVVAGDRTHGPLVIDEYGMPLTIDRDADEYAVQLVAEQDAQTAAFGWDFASLRLSHVFHLRVEGMSWNTIRRRAGEHVKGHRFPLSSQGRRRFLRRAANDGASASSIADAFQSMRENAYAEEYPINAGLTLDGVGTDEAQQ